MSSRARITAVVAVSQNGVIGRDNDMPWRLSSDLRRFKALTLGKPVIMGRKTWESIGRPLPGRPNLVVTRDAGFRAEGAEVFTSLQAAVERGQSLVAELGVDEVCIIGGGNIYAQALPFTDRVYLTRVLAHIDGDTYFPELAADEWQMVSHEEVPMGEKDSHTTRFEIHDRRVS